MSEPQSDLTLSFRDFRVSTPGGRQLVHVPELQLQPGKLNVVIGPNGAGKTSLLRGMAGILDSTGELSMGQKSLSQQPRWKRTKALGYQPQSRPRAEGLTVREFVAASRGASLAWWEGESKEAKEAVADALRLSGAAEFSERMLDSLSGGEAARAALASTIVRDTRWLLLDEPAAALDITAARILYQMLRKVASQSHRSLLMVEHDLGLARSFADQLVLIAGGTLAASDTPERLFESDALERAYGSAFRSFSAGEDTWAVVPIDGQRAASAGESA